MHAQALPAGIGFGPQLIVGGGDSSFHADYSKRTLGGYLVYADLTKARGLGLEVEERVLRRGEEVGTHETTLLLGPRYVKKTRFGAPYGKLLVGKGWFHFPYDYAEGNYLAIAIGGGVDVPIRNSRFSVRAIDFEYQSWPNFTYGGLRPWGISTGFNVQVWGARGGSGDPKFHRSGPR